MKKLETDICRRENAQSPDFSFGHPELGWRTLSSGVAPSGRSDRAEDLCSARQVRPASPLRADEDHPPRQQPDRHGQYRALHDHHPGGMAEKGPGKGLSGRGLYHRQRRGPPGSGSDRPPMPGRFRIRARWPCSRSTFPAPCPPTSPASDFSWATIPKAAFAR